MNNKWKFSESQRIEESSFNKVLERFYDFGISGLVRENIQNSLDGKLQDAPGPVEIVIKTGTIERQNIPGFDEIKDRIRCLGGGNSYTRETVVHMQRKMDEDPIHYISFEDSNTKGLTGAENGQSGSAKDTWNVYAYNKGVHAEEENEDIEKSRGGSHGIGKIASNAASELYTMYFANCDAEGNQHLGGTVQLIEHKYQGKYYRSTGYFTDVEETGDTNPKFYPFKNEFHNVFKKDTRGLKIIIPFLRKQFNNEKEILKSICDSFFIAIMQEKLQVILNDKILNSETIKDYITDKDYYQQDFSQRILDFTPLYIKTYTNQQPMDIKIKDKYEEYNFKLYFKYDESISQGRVAIVRTIGMKIEDKKIKGNVRKPFNAVLIPESIREDAFLKSLENESHTELSCGHIKDQNLQTNATRFINNISKEIIKVIDAAIKENNPTDGLMNTSDILYIVENQFKKDLMSSASTVNINEGKKKKIIVKMEPPIPREKQKLGNKRRNKKIKGLRKVKRPTGDGDNGQIKFSASPDIVDRIIIGNKEIVQFNFKGNKEIGKAKTCDISMAVIDGMGSEYKDEFDMKQSYKSVLDNKKGKYLEIRKQKIKDVEINEGVAQIELELQHGYNKALKFVYYVEV